LAGRFYRCPKCRNGVIAVPLDSGDDSGVLPIAVAESEVDDRKRRTLARIQRAKQETPKAQRALRSNSGAIPVRVDSQDDDESLPFSSSSFEIRGSLRKRELRAQETESEENTLLDLTALEQKALQDQERVKAQAAELSHTSLDGKRPSPAPTLADSDDSSLESGDALQGEQNHRGKVAPIRKVLVECGLCGFHVQIPVEFFGKTIHCPSCEGNAIFTESTLDPIKDEILDRLALETAERRAIYNRGREPSPIAELLRSSAVKSFLVGVGLGVLVLIAMWSAMRVRRSRGRDASVRQAELQGWRYASNAGEKVFHQPWCRQLDPRRPGEHVTEGVLDDHGAALHECE
jgi:hypothetical protein